MGAKRGLCSWNWNWQAAQGGRHVEFGSSIFGLNRRYLYSASCPLCPPWNRQVKHNQHTSWFLGARQFGDNFSLFRGVFPLKERPDLGGGKFAWKYSQWNRHPLLDFAREVSTLELLRGPPVQKMSPPRNTTGNFYSTLVAQVQFTGTRIVDK